MPAETAPVPQLTSIHGEGDLVAELRAGLCREGQKEIPSKYLYDDIGSALFEVITLLPEYGLTRAGTRLLRRHARDIVSHLPSPAIVAELGSGSGKKTRHILEALSHRQPVTYCPIDISAAALVRAEQELREIDSVSIVGYEDVYLEGLRKIATRRQPGEHILVLFLGSTIGNLDRPAGRRFLAEVRKTLMAGDALLLATDLVKPAAVLIRAYDDALGVTAAFNLNMLARINRELEGDFDLRRFRHEARWVESERRVEMHLRSLCNQTVHLQKGDVRASLYEGETIWTENSHKFTTQEVVEMGSLTGFKCRAQWVDQEWPFAQSLLLAD